MLHAHSRERLAIVAAVVPVGISHEDAALNVSHGNGGGVCPHTGRDGDHPAGGRGSNHSNKKYCYTNMKILNQQLYITWSESQRSAKCLYLTKIMFQPSG